MPKTPMNFKPLFTPTLLALILALSGSAYAQEAAIRKALVERLPNLPKIDEVTRSPIAGLWEVRYGGTEIIYSDDKGEYIFVNGSLIDTKTRTDLTQARIEKLLAIDWDQLPLKDAIVIKQGSGARKMAVFVDPNCGYCKRFERDLTAVKDVTIYTFLMPILGPDSTSQVARHLLRQRPGHQLARLDAGRRGAGQGRQRQCDSAAIDRTLEFGQKQRINGTPAVFFTDGTRRPGAISGESVERLLAAAAKK